MALNKSIIVHAPQAVIPGMQEPMKTRVMMDNFVDIYRILNDIQRQLDELKNRG